MNGAKYLAILTPKLSRQWERELEIISRFLVNIPAWKKGLRSVLRAVERADPLANVGVEIFAPPVDFIRQLIWFCQTGDLNVFPVCDLFIATPNDSKASAYIGRLAWDGVSRIKNAEVFFAIVSGAAGAPVHDLFDLTLASTVGALWTVQRTVLDALGLRYALFEFPDIAERFTFQELTVKRGKLVRSSTDLDAPRSLMPALDANSDFLGELIAQAAQFTHPMAEWWNTDEAASPGD
ncbi:MAG TPA: hypothetical protein VHS78_07425 [Candidatus Elarobacter sp.]|nr:hypothetical protein [Candidatus Elarobacter sp.]